MPKGHTLLSAGQKIEVAISLGRSGGRALPTPSGRRRGAMSKCPGRRAIPALHGVRDSCHRHEFDVQCQDVADREVLIVVHDFSYQAGQVESRRNPGDPLRSRAQGATRPEPCSRSRPSGNDPYREQPSEASPSRRSRVRAFGTRWPVSPAFVRLSFTFFTFETKRDSNNTNS